MPIEEVDFEPESFDTILMMGNNFSLFGSLEKAKRLLERLHRIASNDARIIAETRDPYKTSNPAHLEYHEFNRRRGRMGGQLRIRVRFQKYATRWFDYLMVSKTEMKDILKDTGWGVEEFLDSEDSQYIAIIEKIV
jgi:hypothetical protein